MTQSRFVLLSIGAAAFLAMVVDSSATIRRVPSQYLTIQLAIDAAINGDSVLVADGTCFENIRFRGKKIIVASTFLTTNDIAQIGLTMINGSRPTHPDSGSVVSFLDGEDTTSVLCGFTITGGTGTIETYPSPWGIGRAGGGVRSTSGGRICHNQIVHNSVTSTGWTDGGGLEFDPTIGSTGIGLVIIENNSIPYNTSASTGHLAGGGGFTIGGTGRIVNNEVTDNLCSTEATQWYALGGGMQGGLATLTVEDNLIARIKLLAPESHLSGGGAFGGGLYYHQSNMRFCRNTVVDNFVQVGGSTWAFGGGISFSAIDQQHSILIACNRIANNAVVGGENSRGGGLGIIDEGARIQNNIIVGNSAPTGGGVALSRNYLTTGESPTLMNNTVTLNRATSGNGGGIYAQGQWTPWVINTIVWGDTGTNEITLSAVNGFRVLYSDIQGGWGDSANINVDPRFADSTYVLDDSSPCIGAGTDSVQIGGVWCRSPTSDIYGMMRPNPPGSRLDIGASENHRADPLTGIGEKEPAMPIAFALGQNYPNPFNPSTTVKDELPKSSVVRLSVYDMLGREVSLLVNEKRDAGVHEVRFDGSNLASGAYFYRLTAGDFVQSRRLVLMK